MLNLVFLAKLVELGRRILWAVVRPHLLWYPISCELCFQCVDESCGAKVEQLVNLDKLRVIVDQDHVLLTIIVEDVAA